MENYSNDSRENIALAWHSVQRYYLGCALEVHLVAYSPSQRQRAKTEINEIAVLGVRVILGKIQLSVSLRSYHLTSQDNC